MQEQTKTDLKWTAAILIFVVLGLSAVFTNAWNPYKTAGPGGAGTVDHPTQGQLTGRDNLTNMSEQLFKQRGGPGDPPLVVPFELLSLVLIAALVGAVALAFREDA